MLVLLVLSTDQSAHGWKPSSHIALANEVLNELCGSELSSFPYYITLNEKNYKVSDKVGDAICKNQDYFRGGVVGPDGFPDILFGQGTIHPDLQCYVNSDGIGI